MASNWTRKILGMSVILAVSLFLAGCPVPLPSGYAASSRENLSDEVVGQLVPGVSSREEVLLLLGEPDGVGPNESWLAYGSVYSEGGVVFVIFAGGTGAGTGGESMEYHRLIASFDEHGVLTAAQFVNRECWESLGFMGNSSGRSAPCMQVNAPDSGELIAKANAEREAAYQSGELPIPKDLVAFANGKVELITPGWTTGFAAAAAAGGNTWLAKELHDSGQWEALARMILNDKYGDNLRWYYLGRAAEGMALCDTALRYYEISRERSASISTSCLPGSCAGIELPEALEERLLAIEAKRTAGKCSAPPSISP